MKYVYNDGGRKAAGYSGDTGDCVTRSIAIASGKPYLTVYNAINSLAKECKDKHSHSRTGVHRKTYDVVLKRLGATWIPCMTIGSGCKVHLEDGELPMGKLVVRVSKHFTAVIDGVINDTFDPSRNGLRCVYGYFKF